MALKMEVTCSRCKKTHLKTVESVAEGEAFEALEKKKGERLKEILKFFEGIPDEELPDFMVVGGGDTGMVHVSLCDPEGDAKRSCKKRIGEVLKQAAALEERKPRSPNKPKSEPQLPLPLSTVAPAADKT
jgi:hypothetical protein